MRRRRHGLGPRGDGKNLQLHSLAPAIDRTRSWWIWRANEARANSADTSVLRGYSRALPPVGGERLLRAGSSAARIYIAAALVVLLAAVTLAGSVCEAQVRLKRAGIRLRIIAMSAPVDDPAT